MLQDSRPWRPWPPWSQGEIHPSSPSSPSPYSPVGNSKAKYDNDKNPKHDSDDDASVLAAVILAGILALSGGLRACRRGGPSGGGDGGWLGVGGHVLSMPRPGVEGAPRGIIGVE